MIVKNWLIAILAFGCVLISQRSSVAVIVSDETIEETLEKAIDEYEQKRDEEREKLLTKISEVHARLLKNGNVPADQLAWELEQLEQDKQLLIRYNNVLPCSPHLTRYVKTFQRRLLPELKNCLVAFDQAAQDYRKQGDVQRMKLIADAKKAFSLENEAFDFTGVWACSHSNGWRGTRRIDGLFGRAERGQRLTWTRSGTEITVVWPDGIGREVLNFDPQNPDLLTGTKSDGTRITWHRKQQ